LKNTGAISSETADKYFREWGKDQVAALERDEDYQAFKEQLDDFGTRGYMSDELYRLISDAAYAKYETIQNNSGSGFVKEAKEFFDGFFVTT
jgi:hypothetical protein